MMKDPSNLLYTTDSTYVFVKHLLLKIVSLIIAVAAILHYNDNPIVTSIIAAFFFIGFLLLGEDVLLVYRDRIKFFRNSVLKRFLFQRQFLIGDLKSFTITGDFDIEIDSLGDISNMSLILPNSIEVELSTGKTISIPTSIYASKLKTAAGIINKILEEKRNSR